MYFTGYFLLGQVSVHLQGSGFYRVDCCTGKFEEWLIAVTGSFRDRFDELIPIEWIPVAGLPKGIFALPITFVGEWVEYHSGRE
ncbi:MAG: hypothetical protein M5U12_35760 [Verrucomicrobia bacterium]|nr:hypothetical protein [Verrucomicrobiota bacterium]